MAFRPIPSRIEPLLSKDATKQIKCLFSRSPLQHPATPGPSQQLQPRITFHSVPRLRGTSSPGRIRARNHVISCIATIYPTDDSLGSLIKHAWQRLSSLRTPPGLSAKVHRPLHLVLCRWALASFQLSPVEPAGCAIVHYWSSFRRESTYIRLHD